MHKPTSDIWEAEYKELAAKYDKLAAEYLVLQQRHDELKENFSIIKKASNEINIPSNKKLKLEIRSLHRKLRDANRGAERLHLMNAQLRIELVDYKLEHPEPVTYIEPIVSPVEFHSSKNLSNTMPEPEGINKFGPDK